MTYMPWGVKPPIRFLWDFRFSKAPASACQSPSGGSGFDARLSKRCSNAGLMQNAYKSPQFRPSKGCQPFGHALAASVLITSGPRTGATDRSGDFRHLAVNLSGGNETYRYKKGEPRTTLPTIRVHLQDTVWHACHGGSNPQFDDLLLFSR
jgi:hypothetical protein